MPMFNMRNIGSLFHKAPGAQAAPAPVQPQAAGSPGASDTPPSSTVAEDKRATADKQSSEGKKSRNTLLHRMSVKKKDDDKGQLATLAPAEGAAVPGTGDNKKKSKNFLHFFDKKSRKTSQPL